MKVRISMRGRVRRRAALPLFWVGCLLGAGNAARGQTTGHWEPQAIDTGPLGNDGDGPAVAFQQLIQLPPTTPWLRVHFAAAELKKGSAVRVTSMLDGDSQTLNAVHLQQWKSYTAFFNGSAVLLELIAGPHTEGNFLQIAQIWAGDPPGVSALPETICGGTDNRVPSSDERIGRIAVNSTFTGCSTAPCGWCTGWIISEPVGSLDKCHLTAGHCFNHALFVAPVLQFNVPDSDADCSINHPPASDQFAIDDDGATWNDDGPSAIGDDWAVFKCFPNTETGLYTFQSQGFLAFGLADAMPPVDTTVRVTGYGIDGTDANNATGANDSCTCVSGDDTGTRHTIQQTHTGPLTATAGAAIEYQVDTCGGNSGSPVIDACAGEAIGIHTNGGCGTDGAGNPVGDNSGTKITLQALLDAIAVGCPVPPDPNDDCVGSILIGEGPSPPFNTAGSTNSYFMTAGPCGPGGNDVWFAYTPACTGVATLSLCPPGIATFDAILEVFSGSCGALTSLACNDDSCGTAPQVSVAVTQGTTYRIRVAGFSGATGTFAFNIACSPPSPTTDYSDAPAGAGIAVHTSATASERLGTGVTGEPGPITAAWFGDSFDDGIVSVGNLFPGSTSASIVVSAVNPSATFTDRCRVWVDRNLSLGWSTATDALPTQTAAVGPAGMNFTFGPFTLTAAAAPSPYVRARLSFNTTGVASAIGTGAFGEVEDYVLPGTGGPASTPAAGSNGSDAGDAPLPYPPVNSTFINSERLGALVDGDPSAPVGFPTSIGTAAWDDDGAEDDALVAVGYLQAGSAARLRVRATNPVGTFLDVFSAWMDFDGAGRWDEPGEAFGPVSASVGPEGTTVWLGPLSVPVSSVNPVPTRVKLSFADPSQPAHLAAGASFTFGEIEDYLLPLTTGTGCDTGGASAPTTWAEDPPRIGLPFTWKAAGLLPGVPVTLSISPTGIPGGIDLAALNLPIPPMSCFLYAVPFIVLQAGPAGGEGNWSATIPVPAMPGLAGATLHLQSFQVVVNPCPRVLATPNFPATVVQ